MLEIHVLTAKGPLLQCMLYCSEYIKRSVLHTCELGLLCFAEKGGQRPCTPACCVFLLHKITYSFLREGSGQSAPRVIHSSKKNCN